MPEEHDIPNQTTSEEAATEAGHQDPSIPQSENHPTNMEVHHHPHLEKRGFKEYFLEFLMIFLAVTLGFFAEKLRENITKHEHEHKLMKLFVEDLKFDVYKLDSVINYNTQKKAYLDTLRNLAIASADTKLSNEDYKMMYYIYRLYGYSRTFFRPSNRTLDQLEKSEGFGFVTQQNISDSIQSYKEYDERSLETYDIVWNNQEKTHEVGETIFDIRFFNDVLDRNEVTKILLSNKIFELLTYRKDILLLYASKLYITRGVLNTYLTQIKLQKEYAGRLITLVRKAYNLEYE